MNISWVKNTQNNDWFDFLKLNLDSVYFMNKRGIYVIWYTNPSEARVIRLGQGNISERLKEHRNNPNITKYSSKGALKVSWILVEEEHFNGIEKYLARIYAPLEGVLYPSSSTEIPVNLIGN